MQHDTLLLPKLKRIMLFGNFIKKNQLAKESTHCDRLKCTTTINVDYFYYSIILVKKNIYCPKLHSYDFVSLCNLKNPTQTVC